MGDLATSLALGVDNRTVRDDVVAKRRNHLVGLGIAEAAREFSARLVPLLYLMEPAKRKPFRVVVDNLVMRAAHQDQVFKALPLPWRLSVVIACRPKLFYFDVTYLHKDGPGLGVDNGGFALRERANISRDREQ